MPIDSIRSALIERLNGVGEARKKLRMARLTTSLAAFIVNSGRKAVKFARPQSSQQIGAFRGCREYLVSVEV
ncbi:hypothetical protein [Caballeronia insecticola]|uniref:hypothetical protein n=1 Tax=Caballeronia insecticola TaxID=758793 RepID=UPI0011829EA0|nr:hypothetical protein [Caballeronia insecticola]